MARRTSTPMGWQRRSATLVIAVALSQGAVSCGSSKHAPPSASERLRPVVISDPSAGFRAEFPERPIRKEDPPSPISLGRITYQTPLITTSRNAYIGLTVTSDTLRGPLALGDQRSLVDGIKDDLRGEFGDGARLVSATDLTVHGLPAVDVVVDEGGQPDLLVRVRRIVVGAHLLDIRAVTEGSGVTVRDYETLLGTFTPLYGTGIR